MTEKIGEFLIRIGVMQPYQVEDVFRAQEAGDIRLFGGIATDLGYINVGMMKKYVKAKEARERGGVTR